MTRQDQERRLGGIRRLYGDKAVEKFLNSHVCVIGIGGVGSWAAEALARSGIGEITLIDLDNVAESNVNRQVHAVSGEFGKPKITAMCERIFLINPDCKVHEIEDFVTLENLSEIADQKYDFIIDCVDAFRTKAALISHCKRNKINLITIGGAGGQVDPTMIKISDLSKTKHDSLLSQVRKLLRAEYGFPRNLKRRFYIPCVYSDEQLVYPTPDGETCNQKPDNANVSGLNCEGGFGSAMTVTSSFAMAAVSCVLKRLANESSSDD